MISPETGSRDRLVNSPLDVEHSPLEVLETPLDDNGKGKDSPSVSKGVVYLVTSYSRV